MLWSISKHKTIRWLIRQLTWWEELFHNVYIYQIFMLYAHFIISVKYTWFTVLQVYESCIYIYACILSQIWFFVTSSTVDCQNTQSMEISRHEYWSGLAFPTTGDLTNPGTKPMSLVSPVLVNGLFTNAHNCTNSFPFSSVQSLSHIQVFATPWTSALQASLSITNSWSLLKLMSIEPVHPTFSFSVVPFSSCPQSFPASWSIPVSQFFTSSGQNIQVSASASVLPMNTQDWLL